MTTAAILAQRRRSTPRLAVIPMSGAAGALTRCVFCGQGFAPEQDWIKVGYPYVGYICAHEVCSARKDQELTQQRQQH
jgi:hypothetical protein